MKYLRYLLILLFVPFRKSFGLLWYFVALPFRAYARSVVYNYSLENGVYLKRLGERPITKVDGDYVIAPYHGSKGGYIRYKKTNWLQYQLMFWLVWGWVDDDSNYDTYTKGYNKTILDGERFTWLPEFIKNDLQRDYDEDSLYGNSFDLGDKRADFPVFGFWSAYLWTIRNTSYNFKYMLHECRPTDKNFFYFKVGKTHWGYMPSGEHEGRLVLYKDYWDEA